jgi:hypothetical protein
MMTSMSDETARPMGQTQVDRPAWSGRTYRETGAAAAEGDAIAPPVGAETAGERGGKPKPGGKKDGRLKKNPGKKPGPKAKK